MTWLRAAIGGIAALAVGAVLVSGGLETEPPAMQLLDIPGIRGEKTTVLVDSFGRATGRLTTASSVVEARRWLRRARPLGAEAPPWAQRMYLRSLLVLRALTDRRGAVIAGARDGWAYVWPRDAGAVALAYTAAGYRDEARSVARLLLGLDLEAGARFYPDGTPVPGRNAQGDALGWVEAAARATGLPTPANAFDWRERADYQEKDDGNYLGNAIAGGATEAQLRALASERLDSAIAWGVRPFPRPFFFPLARRSLHRLIAERGGRFGIVPSEDWPEEDPWTAPTAWTAWAFAALEDRPSALRLMGGLRRAATPLGLLPERVDAETGEPRSTTPLAWSHAFAILALRELWP